MADENGANLQPAVTAPPPAVATDASAPAFEASKEAAPAGESNVTSSEPPKEVAPLAAKSPKPAEDLAEHASDKPAEKPDVEMKGAASDVAPASAAPESDPAPAPAVDAAPAAAPVASTVTPVVDKSKSRRKSTGGAESKGQKLKKKASKARITHIDAMPGDHFFVKLKGYPPWPAIVCDEDMLPQTLLRSRPVTARRQDGTYRDDFADGGKKVGDRTFPVMYLHTNEFGWVPNVDLHDLEPETVASLISDKMRKDLQKAHLLAAESHPLNHYKDLLQQFQEELEQVELARQEAKEAKEAKLAAQSTPAKKLKKAKAAAADEDGDVDMADVADEDEPAPEKKSSKKRKAEEDTATPQRSDSVKKPKIKITSSGTPKTANGVPTPKSAKSAESKPAKSKPKKEGKTTEDKKLEKEASTPKEPELSQEEKHQRKEKEVLFLRHKLQKGLLTRDQEPKVEEMKMMSDYVTKLEAFPDLEVSIIRATKINKVLKAILKLESIPKEEEFQFKPRSQVLLDKWNKLLSVDGSAPAGATSSVANGVNGKTADTASVTAPASKVEKTETANGVKESGAVTEDTPAAEKSKAPAVASPPKTVEPAAESAAKAPEAVEASS